MADGGKIRKGFWERCREMQEKHLPYNENTVRTLVVSALVMFCWIILWALVFKLGNEALLITTYSNLKVLSPMERILWDLIPFNYRGEGQVVTSLVIDSVLNCFVFAPIGIMLCYLFKKKNLLRDAVICLGLSVAIEILQFATMLGNPATEDLITNTVGCFIGYGLYYLIFRRLSVKQNVIFALVVNLIFGVAVIYSLITFIGSADIIYGIVTRTL